MEEKNTDVSQGTLGPSIPNTLRMPFARSGATRDPMPREIRVFR
jgi:hypothetical protein